jgi:hypothetical protein
MHVCGKTFLAASTVWLSLSTMWQNFLPQLPSHKAAGLAEPLQTCPHLVMVAVPHLSLRSRRQLPVTFWW